MIAFDASAVLAFIFKEPGHEQAAALIDDCCLSAVNLSEVLGRLVRDGHDSQTMLVSLAETNILVVDFDAEQASLAADLLPKSRPLGLSLGDRACLALALARGVPAVTADRAWTGADFGVEVRVIR